MQKYRKSNYIHCKNDNIKLIFLNFSQKMLIYQNLSLYL